MVSDGGRAHDMEVEEEEEDEDELEQDGPAGGPASQATTTATAAATSERATHCQACDDCFCEKGAAALGRHKRNCKPTYPFTLQGKVGVELVFERTARREVGGAPEACRPIRVRAFECPWCPPGTRTYLRGAYLGEHLRACPAAKQQKFVLPTQAPIAYSSESPRLRPSPAVHRSAAVQFAVHGPFST